MRWLRDEHLLFAAMSEETTDRFSDFDLLKNSLLYRQFQAGREEVLKHKWIESEKAGHDIGLERAMTDWILNHRTQWLKAKGWPPGAKFERF
jgi:hypothetical protein